MSVKEAFQPYHTEIKRRGDVTNTEYNSKYFDRTDDNALPFIQEDQVYILFSLSHTGFAPVSQTKSAPGLRIYGAFPDQQSLHHYADLVKENDPVCSLLMNKTHEWIVGASSPAHLTDNEHIRAQKDRLLRKHKQTLSKNKAEFECNIAQHQVGECVKKEDLVHADNDIDDKTKVCRKISSRVHVDDQRLAAVTVVPDDTQECEFLFKVYGFFQNEEQANSWVRNVGGDAVTDFDIDIVSACEWIYPQAMISTNAKREVYRSAELTKIMKNYKSNPDEVRRVEELELDSDMTTESVEETVEGGGVSV